MIAHEQELHAVIELLIFACIFAHEQRLAMACKAFSTDYELDLPWGRIEPYRLWFEYLKFVYNHPDYKSLIDNRIYESWGDVANEKFNDWWERNWRKLFAIPASIEILKNATEQEDSIGKKGSLVVRIRRRDNIKTQLADLKRLIERLEPSESAKPLYKLSATHSITDKALRANLRLGELFTQTGSIEDAAEQYCDRVEKWNEKVKKWNSAKKKAVDRRREMFVSLELESFARKVKELRSDI